MPLQPYNLTNDGTLAFAASCSADYGALNALHNGLIDWALTVPVRE